MAQKKVFLKDDFERINKKYFKELRKTGKIKADPSYWFNLTSNASVFFGNENIQKYNSDFYSGLKHYKNRILDFLNVWDEIDYTYDAVTLCSSVTSGSLVVLACLKNLGVEEILFETPAYFASIDQAEKLGLKVSLLPTYEKDAFLINENHILNCLSMKKAVWVTQPRFALGTNQSKKELKKVLNALRPDDYLIIDEATEQYFPSYLNEFNFRKHKNIIKLRSFFKGMGINGPRIAFISHAEELRNIFEIEIEKMQGSLDYFSLNFLFDLLSDIEKFKTMLRIANKQVLENYKTVNLIAMGSLVTPTKIENGYIGSASIDISHLGMKYLKSREYLLKFCNENHVPVIIGASMKFAIQEEKEFIRLNYFNDIEDLSRGVDILTKFR